MIQTYRTRRQALRDLKGFRGWAYGKIEHMYMPDSSDADSHGYTYVICCNQSAFCAGYMRTDGYIG